MKKLILIISALLSALFVSLSFAAEEVTLFDGTFTRDSGKPVVVSRTFRAADGVGSVELTNGTNLSTRISSATLQINGVKIFGPSDFNKNVSKLEKQVRLKEGENSLTLLLDSGPGGSVRINIHMLVEIILAPAAKMVDETTINNLSSISEDGTALLFSAATSQIDSMQTGDVIISGITATTPYGMLKKVVSKTKWEDGSVVLITEAASLTDAFQELHLTGTIPSAQSAGIASLSPLRTSAVEPFPSAGIAPLSLLQPSSLTPFPSVRYSTPPWKNVSVGVGGSLSCTWSSDYNGMFDLDYDIHIHWFKLERFYLALAGRQDLVVNGQCEAKGKLDVNYEKTFAQIIIAPITIPPLVLTWNFEPGLGVNFSGEGTFDLSFGFNANNNVKLGFGYVDTQGWSGIKEWDFNFEPYHSMAGEEWNVVIKPYARLKFPVRVFGVAGPYVDVRPYAKLSSTVDPAWDCQIGAGVSANCGGDVAILSWTLGQFNIELLDLYWPILACYPGTAVISGKITGPGGEPIQGVTVALGGTSQSGQIDTDLNGDYKFTVPQHEVYSVTPLRAGYIFSPPTRLVSVTNSDVSQQDFTASGLSCIPKKFSPTENSKLMNGCTDNSKTITWNFDWEDCSGATMYELQVYEPSVLNPRINVTVSPSSYEYNCNGCSILENLTGWRWKVRAYVDGEWGLWSNDGTFDVETVDTGCPPSLVYSISGKVFYSTIALSDVKVELIKGSITDPPNATTLTNESGGFTFDGLQPGTYNIKIYGPNIEYITWAGFTVTITNSNITSNFGLPKKINLLSPENGSTVSTSNPTFCWKAPLESTRYTFQLNKTSDWTLTAFVHNISGTCYQLTDPLQPLENNVLYTWQVGAQDQYGQEVGTTENAFQFLFKQP